MAREFMSPGVVYEATDPKQGMTMGELRSFVQDADMLKIADNAVPKIVANWKSGIRTISAQGVVKAKESEDSDA